MSKENKQTTKRFLNLTLVSVLAATIVSMGAMTGCTDDSDKKESKGESVVTETQVVTKEVNGVYVDENGSIVTEPDTTAAAETTKASNDKKQQSSKTGDDQQNDDSDNDADNNDQGNNDSDDNKSGSNDSDGNKSDNNTSSKSGSSNSKSSNSSGNSGSGSSNKSSKTGNSGNSGVPDYNSGSTKVDNNDRRTTPSNAQTAPVKEEGKEDDSAKNLTIGGKTYNVGDKITCTYFLTVPKDMLNFQGAVNYDSSLLKQTNVYLVAPASYGSVINPNLSGRILFNGSMISGYDFTEPGYEFLVVEYEVLKNGTANPSITFEVLSDTGSTSYVSGGALTGGAKVSAVYE